MTTKTKRMHIALPEHLKKQVELVSNYYGITQSEFIKDAIKEKMIKFGELRKIK